MMNTRLPTGPCTSVKMPQPLVKALQPEPTASVRWSSQNGNMALLALKSGKQVLVKAESPVVKSTWPLEDTCALVKGTPYKLKANGRVMAVRPSSVWLPVSVTPGVSATPVEELTT